jgi:TolA-binding protein
MKCNKLIAFAILWTPVVALAVPKYSKKEASIQATQTALTKPTQKPKEDKKRPDVKAQDVFSGVGEQLKQVTQQQIDVLQRLIDNTPDDALDDKGEPEKPDLLFRLAELYNEQQHYYNFSARDLDQKVFDAQQANNTAEAEKFKAQQAEYEKTEKKWLVAAVKQYKAIIDNPKFERYRRMDQVLFYLAFLLTQQKREDLALPFFKRLIKDFPKSPYVPDAYYAFGEYYFDQSDVEKALKFFDKVLEFPDSRVFGYAKYYKGWCFYNLQDYEGALKTFVDVINYALAGKKDPNKAALLKEARKDSVRTYAQIAPADKAWPFFQRIGGDYAPTMMELLGELYNGQGKFDESIKVYRQLMKISPMSPKLCTWQTEVLRNTLSRAGSRATQDSVDELQRLSALYEKYSTLPGVRKDQVDECRENTSGMLRELATTWHKEAQQTNVKETYDLAHYLYKEYINRFPMEKDIYPMTYYYGELLWKLERYCDAAPIYTNVVKLDPSDKAMYRDDAAYAAVIAWKNCLNLDDSGRDAQDIRKQKNIADKDKPKVASEKGEKGKGKGAAKVAEGPDLKPKEIPEKSLKMIDAFDTYIKYVPKAKELPNIKWHKARVYYEFNHFEEAIPIYRDLVDNHRDSELAIYAVNLLFDCENATERYDDLDADTKKYCVLPDLNKDTVVKQQCDTIQTYIARKKIEKWEKDGLHRKAADEYVRLATQHPEDPRLAELYYNASFDYEKAKAIGLAIQMRLKLIELKPDDPLSKKAVYLLGQAYQDIAVFDKAAEQYEQFATKYPGEKAPTDASQALYTASFFRRGLGDIDKSVEDTNTFIKLYGGHKEYEDKAAGVFFDLGRIYEEQKDWDKLTKHLNDYLKLWGAKGGIDRQIITYVKLGEISWRASCTAPGGGINGACIQLTRLRSSTATGVAEKNRKSKRKSKGSTLPAQCGPETKSKITIFERKPAQAKEAQNFFAIALRLYGNGEATKKVPGKDETERNARLENMMYHVAEARMMQGDEEYEKLLTLKIPEKLNFTPPDPNTSKGRQLRDKKRLEENQKKFKTWLEMKTKSITSAQVIYQNVILFKQAHWAIAAAARIGQLFQDFSGQLYTAPIPKAGSPPAESGLTQEDFDQIFHDAYCDAMVDQAEPLEAKAIEGLKTCLETSTRLSWYNDWSSLCESELNQIKPAEYPLAAELRATPGYFDRKLDPAPLATEVK